MAHASTALIQLDAANRLLAEAQTLPDLVRLINRAEALRHFARQVDLGLETQNRAAELRNRAQRKAGQLLQSMWRAERGRTTKKMYNGHTLSEMPPTLDDIGVTRVQASAWQAVADLPADIFETYINDTIMAGRELTSAGVLRLVREHRREARRASNRELVASGQSLAAMPHESFATIVIDPPWDWADEGDGDQLGRARPTYATLRFDELLALPIRDRATGDAHLYLWITNRSLPKGFALLDAWGFRYVTCLTWCKPSFGMGNYFRGSTEHVLFGVRGSLGLLRADLGTWFEADRPGRHSDKPERFYELVESASPGPWLEIFARRTRPGWAVWGAEVDGAP